MATAHPGFKGAMAQMMKRDPEMGAKSAGAILAVGARHASPAAKKANPNLAKVK